MLQSNTANRANKAKSENVTVNGKQILVTMIARISRDQKYGVFVIERSGQTP